MTRADINNKDSLTQLCSRLSLRVIPEPLIEELGAFNSELGYSEQRERNISALRDRGTVAVLTGQQVGLFGGPLLTFYKALKAVVVSRSLSTKLERKVVPIFWVQSEDHDLEEIAQASFLKSDGSIGIFKPRVDSLNRVSVSDLSITGEIHDAIRSLALDSANTKIDGKLLSWLEESYSPEMSWSAAFVALMAKILSEEGIIFFDPQSQRLRSKSNEIFKNIMRYALDNTAQINQRLADTSSRLALKKNQGVTIRENSPLFFFSDETGARYRLEAVGESRYRYIGREGEISALQISELLEREPSRFTSSALLRPILQDTLFPTVAYIGGDAELIYHRQLDDLYGLFSLTPPALVCRLKCTLVDPKVGRFISELDLDLEQYRRPLDEIIALSSDLAQDRRHQVHQSLAPIFHALENEIQVLDQTLLDPLLKTKQSVESSFEKFFQKLSKAQSLKNDIVLRRIERVKDTFYPLGHPQERMLTLGLTLLQTGLGIKNKLLSLAENPSCKQQVLCLF